MRGLYTPHSTLIKSHVSGLWDNRTMRKGLKALVCLLVGASLMVVSVSPAHAQNKPDPKVMKDCEAVNETYDNASFMLYLQMPLSHNRDAVGQEFANQKLDPSSVLIECDKIDMKSWKSMKKDYILAIKSANLAMKKIVTKYKISPLINLTCVKNGKITKIESTNPKCPKGYKKLY